VAHMVAIFRGRCSDLLQQIVRLYRAVSKEFKEDVIAAGLLADLQQLTTTGQARDLVRNHRLIVAAKTLGNGVFRGLVQAPEISV
jgi:hypothetical protein